MCVAIVTEVGCSFFFPEVWSTDYIPHSFWLHLSYLLSFHCVPLIILWVPLAHFSGGTKVHGRHHFTDPFQTLRHLGATVLTTFILSPFYSKLLLIQSFYCYSKRSLASPTHCGAPLSPHSLPPASPFPSRRRGVTTSILLKNTGTVTNGALRWPD